MNKLKYSAGGQMLLMAKTHLVTSLLFFILFIFLGAKVTGFGYKVFGACGLLGYFLSIYANAGSALSDDRKTISPLTAKPWKGFILPVGIIIINVIFIILYKLAWTYGSDGTYLNQAWAYVFNVLPTIWVTQYHPFLGMARGVISLSGYLIIFVTPVLASALGYFAAYKGFDLNAKMHSIAYEKKDKDEF